MAPASRANGLTSSQIDPFHQAANLVAVSETLSGASGDRRERLRDVEGRPLGHPAHLAYQSCFALERSIAVYSANFGELMTLLERAATDERLAVELVQNVHAPFVRERFHVLVSQRLLNYLAATSTLADHTLRIMKGRTGVLADEYRRRKAQLVAHPASHAAPTNVREDSMLNSHDR